MSKSFTDLIELSRDLLDNYYRTPDLQDKTNVFNNTRRIADIVEEAVEAILSLKDELTLLPTLLSTCDESDCECCEKQNEIIEEIESIIENYLKIS